MCFFQPVNLNFGREIPCSSIESVDISLKNECFSNRVHCELRLAE